MNLESLPYLNSSTEQLKPVANHELSISLDRALLTTITGINVFRGTHSIVILQTTNNKVNITHANQYLDENITQAYGSDLLYVAYNKAIAEIKSRLSTGRTLQSEIHHAKSNGFPHHNGSFSLVTSNSILAIGVSGALPSAKFLQLIGQNPDTPIPEISNQGFFDRLLARQTALHLKSSNQPIDIPLPAYLKWAKDNYSTTKNTDFAIRFASFNQ
jgi:hypothetical protein